MIMDTKEKIENYIREAHEKGAFTGTWLFAERGEIVSKGAIGYLDAADKEPIQENSLFDVASISKQFTAAAIMLLQREGLLTLDDAMTEYFPGIPCQGVTIRHLLNCTSGLPDYLKWVEKTAREENIIPGNDILIRFLRENGQNALFAPGEKWSYCNTGFCIAAQIVENVSGVSFDEFLREKVFVPAGMHDTRVIHRRKDKTQVDNLAYGLVVQDDKYVLPDDTTERANAIFCDGLSGDGLVHTNIFDLLAWDRALREEKVLTRKEQRLMYTPGNLNDGSIAGTEKEKDGYGFGWGILNDPAFGLVVDHAAGWAGYEAWYERFIDADKVLIWLSCREFMDVRAYETFVYGMRALVRGQMPESIKTIEEIAVKEADKSKWMSYCGKYEHPRSGSLIIDEIYMKDGTLYAKAEDDYGNWGFRLYPLGANVFGRKGGMLELSFGDGFLMIGGMRCKKL